MSVLLSFTRVNEEKEDFMKRIQINNIAIASIVSNAVYLGKLM